MNIIFPIPNFAPQEGLIATYYENLSKLLSGQGHHIFLLLTDNNSSDEDEDEIIKINDTNTRVMLKKSYHYFRNRYIKYFRPGGFEAYNQIANGLATREWLLKNHSSYMIDIIQTPDYGGLGIFLSDNNLPPLVIFGHGCLTQLSRYNYTKKDSHVTILKRLEQLSFEQADAIATHSPLNQHDLEKLTGRKIEFAIAPWKNINDSVLPSSFSNSMVVAGGLQAIKGALIMADAMRICTVKKLLLRLNWFGGNTYSADKNQSMAGLLEKNYPEVWNKKFIWRDKITRKETIIELAAAAFVIIPSLWETFGWTAVEAAYLGKAIIITDKTGAAYLFTHGHDAWIIPANDPRKLAEAIERLSNDPGLCEKLGNNAKLMMKKVFDEKEIVEDRIRQYQHIIKIRKLRSGTLDQNILFLKEYTTQARKIKYKLRAIVKKIAGRF